MNHRCVLRDLITGLGEPHRMQSQSLESTAPSSGPDDFIRLQISTSVHVCHG